MHVQGGTHEEMPLSILLVVNGAPELLAKAEVYFGMVQREIVLLRQLKLVESESQDLGDVGWFDGKDVIMCWNEGHVIVVK